MIRALLTIGLLVAACGEPSEPAAAAPASELASAPGPRAPTLRVGDRHVYTLVWHAEATRRQSGAGISGALTLEGQLAVSVLAAGPEGTRLSLAFPSLPRRELRAQGSVIPLDASMLEGRRAEILVDGAGDVRRAFFDPSDPPVFRELMTGVIARLDLRAGSAGGEPLQIRSGHGLVEATYHAQADNVVTRELAGVLRFDTAPGTVVDAEQLVAEGRIELDADRVPVAIELHDSVDMPGENGLVADDRFSLTRVGVEQASAQALVDPMEIDPNAAPDMAAAAREVDRQYATDFTTYDVAIALRVADGGLQPADGEFSQAAALLRGWPERADELIPMVLRSSGGGRQLAFDMLSAAGTERAQAVMRTLLSQPEARQWPERMLLVQRFAFVSAPSAESGEFLLAIADAAAEAGDAELHRGTLHVLGAVAARATDPWLAERMHARLVATAADDDGFLRAGAIAGLGNAKRPDDVARLVLAATDADSNVRIEAVSGLRHWVAANTTRALLEAIADEDRAVASTALDVLRKRHYEGRLDAAFIERAREGKYHPELDGLVVSALVEGREVEAQGGDAARADARVALAAIGARTVDRELADHVAQLL